MLYRLCNYMYIYTIHSSALTPYTPNMQPPTSTRFPSKNFHVIVLHAHITVSPTSQALNSHEATTTPDLHTRLTIPHLARPTDHELAVDALEPPALLRADTGPRRLESLIQVLPGDPDLGGPGPGPVFPCSRWVGIIDAAFVVSAAAAASYPGSLPRHLDLGELGGDSRVLREFGGLARSPAHAARAVSVFIPVPELQEVSYGAG